MDDRLKTAVEMALSARERELDCDECLDLVSRYAEESLDGVSPGKAHELLEHHLKTCTYCREEFQALKAALQELNPPRER